MNAYLFSAIATRSQVRPTPGRYSTVDTLQTWDGCSNAVVGGASPDEAQKRFEAWFCQQPEGENPVDIRVRKIAAAQFVDQLLTESGNAPLDWPKILNDLESETESTPVDDFEQGYWVDVEQVVRPEKLSLSISALQSNVPEDIRSGLNWNVDKKFLFVLSVLSPLAPQVEPVDEVDDSDSAESPDEDAEKTDPITIGELFATYPQALDKEAAALIQARNSVVAAWLWRRFAASTRLAGYQIRIDPWCGAIGLDGE